MDMYPKRYLGTVRRLTKEIGVSADTAYSMILMTAALMDLQPDDPAVAEMILADCGIYPEKRA